MPLTIRQRALGEMRHRAIGAGFRPAVLRGDWSELARKSMRADALSRRAESVAGSRLIARDPHAHAGSSAVIGVLAVGAGIAIGYAIGKWLKKKNASSTYLHGIDAQISSNRYLIGAAVLAQ